MKVNFNLIAPQSNFTVTQGRFTMSVIIILPRGAQLHGEPLAISPEVFLLQYWNTALKLQM
ncbi:hypothetical protein CN380_26550 [Bacillus sp. AFS017274]|nr:hypothetical protein CN380_26550 [Bacillus sp. AFS017274]